MVGAVTAVSNAVEMAHEIWAEASLLVTQEQFLCSSESKTRLMGRNNQENRIVPEKAKEHLCSMMGDGKLPPL